MANYIVLNSNFTPYTFQDKIAPYQEYAKLVALARLTMQQLDMEIAAWEDLLSQNPDDELLKLLYAKYKENTDKAMEYFYNYGLLGDGELKMVDTFKGYRKTIVPMQEAYQRRSAAIDKWGNDFDANARYIGNSPEGTSLTSWMHGATPNIYRIKGSDIAELSKNLTLGVTTDLLDDSDVLKITQGINPDSLYNIIYSIEQNNDSILTNKEKLLKQHLNSIINAVKADYDFNSLTEDLLKQFMKEVYTGILLGNVYNEELKKSSDNGDKKDGLIDLSDLKTVPLDATPLLSPNIRNREKSNKDLIVEVHPELEPYITDEGKLRENPTEIKKLIIIADYLNPLIEKEFRNILEEKGLKESELSYVRRFNIREQATSNVLFKNNIMTTTGGYYYSEKYPEDLRKKLAAVKDVSDIEQTLNSIDIEKLRKSYLANFHEIRFKDPKAIAKYIIDKAAINAGEDNLSLKRVKLFKPKQTKDQNEDITRLEWEFDEGKAVKKKDFEWDDNNNYIGSTPFFYRSMVESDNPGLVMNIEGIDYFVPQSLLGGIDLSESYLHKYNLENDEYDSALKSLEEYAKSKNYINEDGSWKKEAENDEMLNLLYMQVLAAQSTKQSAAAQFTGNIADLFYTIETPTYKH